MSVESIGIKCISCKNMEVIDVKPAPLLRYRVWKRSSPA